MKFRTRLTILVVGLAVVGLACSTVMAHPFDTQELKFQQEPMDGVMIHGKPYFGHDELSAAWRVPDISEPTYQGDFMADDFADRFDRDVVHVKWWGSYWGPADAQVNKFLVSFESDVPDPDPGDPATFSRPGYPLLNQVVKRGSLAPGSGTFTEKWISPGGIPANEALYEYNAELRCPFDQKPNTVYWLKIVALLEPEDDFGWGWHNRDYTVRDTYASTPPAVNPGEHVQGIIPPPAGVGGDPVRIWHFQDDSVTGWTKVVLDSAADPCYVHVEQDVYGPQHYWDDFDGPGLSPDTNFPGIGAFSKDLAFELYTPIPEPSTLVLLGMGLVALVGYTRRRG